MYLLTINALIDNHQHIIPPDPGKILHPHFGDIAAELGADDGDLPPSPPPDISVVG